MKTKIYGASDDLIEIEGAISDEVNVYPSINDKSSFSASDGTKGKIYYDNEGQWRIEVLTVGNKFITKISAVGDNDEHIGEAAGCSSYSDVLILDEGIEWVKINGKTFKP